MVTSDPDPPILYEGLRLTLTCDVTKGSHLSYTWFYNRQEVPSSPTSPLTPLLLWPVGNTLVVERVTTKHAGNYSCIAGTRMQTNSRFSSSREVTVRVKGTTAEFKSRKLMSQPQPYWTWGMAITETIYTENI